MFENESMFSPSIPRMTLIDSPRLPQLSSGGVKGRNKCDPTERAKAVALSDRASKTFQQIEVDNIWCEIKSCESNKMSKRKNSVTNLFGFWIQRIFRHLLAFEEPFFWP